MLLSLSLSVSDNVKNAVQRTSPKLAYQRYTLRPVAVTALEADE